jgi:hypothetical protein
MRLLWAFIAASAGLVAADLGGMFAGGLQHPAIQYLSRPTTDPVGELNRKVQSGQVRLKYEPPTGYLRSLLSALDIPIESQLVVFSKTSILARFISPPHPRTVFFNESVVVTWIPGEPFVELAAEDPRQGIIFYTIDEKPSDRPLISRRSSNCLTCHNTLTSLGVPGMLVRSVMTNDDGTPLSNFVEPAPDDRTPFSERWGGWYVTGNSVPPHHRGNARMVFEAASRSSVMSTAPALKTLAGRLDSDAYPTPYSDVVALMVFEHQMNAMNLLTRAGWESRLALQKSAAMPVDTLNELADYLVFTDEWPISSRIEGNSGFAEKFTARGPLREFDLHQRLFRYRCSYMVYSPAFDALPEPAKDIVYRRMWSRISKQDNAKALVQILRTTKPGLPDYFSQSH